MAPTSPGGALITSSQILSSVNNMRFDKEITGFEFKPSLGIVAKRIDTFSDSLRDFREPLRRSVRFVMIPSIRANFQAGGRPEWPELSPQTIKRAGPHRPLILKGRLRRGATSIGIWTITKIAATVKDLPPSIWYGKIHQAGHGGALGELAAGQWFKKYQGAAKKVLGPEATSREVDKLGMEMFDKRMTAHGPAPAPGASIPARPFIMFQDEDMEKIEKVFVGWLTENLRRAGLYGTG